MLIGYSRVLDGDQKCTIQADALKVAGCQRVFCDDLSASQQPRPELKRCLSSLKYGDTLVVWRLDRLCFNLKDLVAITSELEERSVGFRSLVEGINTTQPGGEVVFKCFAALRDFEHNVYQELTRSGMAAARARGQRIGRKPALSPSEVEEAKLMLSRPGVTKKEVANHLGVSRVTLDKWLKEFM